MLARLAVAAATIVLAAPASASSAAGYRAEAAWVRDCNHQVGGPHLVISSVRNMRCRTAVRVMRRVWTIRRTFHAGPFFCRRVSGGRYGGQWRCVDGRRAFRFDFAD